MSRRQFSWFVAMLTLLLIVSVSAPAFPQEPETVARLDVEPPTDSAAVEQVLRQQANALRTQQFSYEPAGRRDPFLSLMTPRIVDVERPPGVAGMLVAEIDLAGVVQDGYSGDVAMVIGSDNKGYFLRVGDEVFDGTVIAVDPRHGVITFRQQVDDPRRIKPYRDVEKRLVPTEGGSNE